MATAYFYMTSQGQKIVDRMHQERPGLIFDKQSYKDGVKKLWASGNTLVFVMAMGIVVRTIAPYIRSKTTDPAVIVIDQNGEYVISLLSGHLGGANEAARQIADMLHARPVITTATDVAEVTAFDVAAKENGLEIKYIENLKYISAAMVEYQPVRVISQWQIAGNVPANVTIDTDIATHISTDVPAVIVGMPSFCRKIKSQLKDADESTKMICLTAPVYVIGTGCKKNMDAKLYAEALGQFMTRYGISREDVRGLATIDLKKDEACIRSAAEDLDRSVLIYSKDELDQVDLKDASGQEIKSSDFVKQVTGVGSVSEACAYLASGCGKILVPKTKYEGITFALAMEKKVVYL